MSKSKLSIFKETRALATKSLVAALSTLLQQERFSEVDLRDAWLSEMRKHDPLRKDGWYVPPPHGVAVLFGNPADNHRRINIGTLRKEENWPRNDVYFNKAEGSMLLYASPIDKASGVIGDLGLTLYVGKNEKIIEHFKNTYALTQKIFEHAQVGMTFAELTVHANYLLQQQGLQSDVVVTTSRSPMNLGHTIPSTEEPWTVDEQNMLASGNSEDVSAIISKKRVFVDTESALAIKPGLAFTIEPRPRVVDDPNIPMAFFHTVCLVHEDGTKEFVTGFDEVFRMVGMAL